MHDTLQVVCKVVGKLFVMKYMVRRFPLHLSGLGRHFKENAIVNQDKPGDTKDCPEWAIVDLQGDLETRHPVPLSGKFIGDLHFTNKDAPVLIIGHHILFGKVVELEKPFAVLAKEEQPQTEDVAMETDQTTSSYLVQAIIKKKLLFKTRPKPIISHVPKKL